MSETTPTPPDACPVCGMAEDWRDTDGGRVNRVAFMCGARWARYNGSREPLSPPEWVSDCSHAMTAALRVGATLAPSPLELARQQLIEQVGNWAGVFDGMSTPAPVDYDLLGAYRAYLALTTRAAARAGNDAAAGVAG